MSDDVDITRVWAMPNKWTFDIPAIEAWVDRHVDDDGLWIDPFAGTSDVADVTNDLHPARDTDYTMYAEEFLAQFDDGAVDGGVIFDPPYSASQLKRQYDNIGVDPDQSETNAAFFAKHRDAITRVCAKGATVLSFGWNSTGVGQSRGFTKEEILMVNHGSRPNDTICVAETYSP